MRHTAARYRRSPRALERRVGDAIILTLPERAAFEQLTTSSAMTWRLLDAPRTLAALIERLARLYGTEPRTIASDVESLLNDLIGRDLIEEIEGTGV